MMAGLTPQYTPVVHWAMNVNSLHQPSPPPLLNGTILLSVCVCVCVLLVMNGQASQAVILCVTKKSHARPLCNVRHHPDSR